MATPRRSPIVRVAVGVLALLLLSGVAATVYALVVEEWGSDAFTATILWGRALLIAAAAIGITTYFVRRQRGRKET